MPRRLTAGIGVDDLSVAVHFALTGQVISMGMLKPPHAPEEAIETEGSV